MLEAKPGATKKELKWAQGYLLLQFNDAVSIDYKAEAVHRAAASGTVAEIRARKIHQARKDFQV